MSLILPVRWVSGVGGCGAYSLPYGGNLAFWLDACDTSTLWQNKLGTSQVTTEGQEVNKWDDRSNDITTISSKPDYDVLNFTPLSPATYEVSALGVPSVYLGGGGGSSFTYNTGFTNIVTPGGGRTIFCVHYKDFEGPGTNGNRRNLVVQIGFDSNSPVNETQSAYGNIYDSGPSPVQRWIYSDMKQFAGLVSGFTYDQLQVSEWNSSGAGGGQEYLEDGNTIAVTQEPLTPAGNLPTTEDGPTDLYIGQSFIDGSPQSDGFHSGYMCELLIYNEEVSSANRTAIRNYLTSKWGI